MSRRVDILRAALEAHGYTVGRVWWEPATAPMEMCGHGGGWLAELPAIHVVEPLGLSFAEALQRIHELPDPAGHPPSLG
jgi:hypothetical protein